MSDIGWDRANQLVVVEVSVDFKKHTLLSSAHEHEQRDSANERIVMVTDKVVSAVNCPIEVAIVPLRRLLLRYLLISKARTDVINTRIRTETAQNERIVIVTHKVWSAVNCPTKVETVPVSSLLLRALLISQRTHSCYQHTNTNRADSANALVGLTCTLPNHWRCTEQY